MIARLCPALVAGFLLLAGNPGQAQALPAGAKSSARPPAAVQDYVLGSGDIIKISVFQNPDLTLETRVSENGTISFPLIGACLLYTSDAADE